VALSEAQQRRLVEAAAALIWCPTSNLHLFDRTPDIRFLFARRRLALGSDSRVSGQRDLLAELRVAREVSSLDDAALESLVTDRAAEVLRLPDRGVLRPHALADLVVLPAGLPLSQASRTDIRLVLVGGVPRYADPDLAEAFGREADLVEVRVDGHRKFLARPLVDALVAAQIHEPGLDALLDKAA
jgi:cytosine/adenosine deaminase-related metal-dependent hydrolase